eukprot:9923602-Karenia_brevis.AAC.1
MVAQPLAKVTMYFASEVLESQARQERNGFDLGVQSFKCRVPPQPAEAVFGGFLSACGEQAPRTNWRGLSLEMLQQEALPRLNSPTALLKKAQSMRPLQTPWTLGGAQKNTVTRAPRHTASPYPTCAV